MEYRELGKTGIKISVVGFGGMRLPGVSDDEAINTVRRALDLGINFFETGWNYGQGRSETLLGQGLEGRRHQVVLANKTNAFNTERPAEIREHLERSLRNEQTDHFDLYSFWGVNNLTHLEQVLRPGIFDSLLKFKQEGKVRAVGLTTHAQPDEIVAFAEKLPLDAVTLKYNMLSRRMEEAIRALHKKGVGVIIMTPLAGGVVANPGDEIKQELAKHALHPAVLGLRYLTANLGVTSAISGMCRPEEVDLNVQAGKGGPLKPIEREMIGLVQQRLAGLGEKFCTGCGYCLPCPQGVGIPSVFRLWNIMRGYGNASYSRGEYGKMREGLHWADYRGKAAEHCTECGECEEKCPEKLPVREDLKKAHAELAVKK